MEQTTHRFSSSIRTAATAAAWICSAALVAQEVKDSAALRRAGDGALAISEVVVTGSNEATGRDMLPYTVSAIGGKELEASGQNQLLSAISGQVPGLFVSERNMYGFGISNGGSGGIKIRGVGGSPTNAVLMMVDGQPQFAGIYSHHVADFYAKEYVGRVEVLRGPGSVLYGSNAMGGVVNVITKEAAEDGMHVALSSQYGSYDTWLSSLTHTMHYGKFSSLVSADFDRTDGTTDHFDFKQQSVYAKVNYALNRAWKLQADYSLMHFKGNDPIYATLDDPTSTDIYHQNVTRGAASVSATNRYGRTDGHATVYYSYGNHYVDDPNHFHSLDDRFGVLVYQNFRPTRGTSATLGFDFDTYTGRVPMSGGRSHTDGSLTTIDHKSVTEYSPYITVSQSLIRDMLTLNAGLRMANSDRFGTEWVPQAGFAVRPGHGWTVKGSLAKGYRNPSFRELYLYRTANADLEPESMMNYEVTVGKTFARLGGIDVTAFFSEGSDMIQTVSQKNVNTGSFINKGIEVSAYCHPLEVLSLRASYSYLHTSLDDLTGAPKNQYFIGVGWAALPCLSVDAEMKGVGSLYVCDTMHHQDYVLLNLKLTFRPCALVDLFVTFDNITDAHYTINEGYKMPGFNCMGGFRWHI